MPRVQNPSIGAGQAPMLVNTTVLSSAQLLALPGTPVQLIPAPGAGKMILPFTSVYSYNFGTRRYFGTETNGLGITYAGQPVTTIGAALTNVIFGDPSTIVFIEPFITQPSAASAFTNQPLVLATDATTYGNGPIVTATLGAGGSGYVANDTGTITTGSADATYKVLTVGAGGAVLTFQITGAGTDYPTGNGQATAVGGAQPGVGTGFTVNITAVNAGDGTLKIITFYQVITVP